MFDIGFSELLLIGIAALVVFGPEDLPRVARTVGHLIGKFRRYVSDVKSDISREMEAAELKNLVSDVHASARTLQASLNEQASAFESEIGRELEAVKSDLGLTGPVELSSEMPQESMATPALAIENEDVFEQAPENTATSTGGDAVESTGVDQLDLFGMPVSQMNSGKD